ncbi:EH domain-binding protein 1-like [Montipora foliosa]|uniref:EH domain-binding protein 1-like n=1 Tax=Montipora foliosa TaxID=591990 RepID=UPI0035F0FCBE
MKFSLSSVMLQDGVPFITKEDLIREILHDAEKSAADKKTEKIRIENANKTVPAVNSADVNNSAELPQPSSKQELSAAKESGSDARKINKNNNNNDSREEKKTAGDGKQPSLPNLPTAEEQQTHMMADSATEECDINGAKESSAQKNNEEKTSAQNKHNSMPAGRHGRKEKNKDKKPMEGTSLSGSSDKKRNVSATETGLPCNEKSGKAFEGLETSDVEGKRNDGDEKIVLSSSKTKTSCPGQSGAEGGSGEKLSSSDSSGTSVQTVVDKTKRIKSEANVKNTVTGSEEVVSSVPGEQTISGDKEDEATANGTQEPPAKDLNSVEKEKQRLACFFDKLRKPAPCKGSSGGGQVVGKVRCQTKIQVSGHNCEVAGEIKKDATATATEKVPPTNGDAEGKEKQRLACFFNKLLKSAPHKAPETVCCPQLSEYVAEEMTLLKKEIASLDKVTLKLEQEIRQAMDIADCSEELHSLTQDWFIMVDYRAELVSRRNNLQILDKQGDVEQCCNIMRSELKLLFTLEDWRKTAYHKAQQAKLLDLLFTFVNVRREN